LPSAGRLVALYEGGGVDDTLPLHRIAGAILARTGLATTK